MAKKIIFIDSAVPDFKLILGQLAPDSVYHILDNTRDGLSQMADILAGYSGLDSIHLISHGSSGSLQLGSSFVTQYTLGNYSAALATIGNSLSATGDILLYGCDVAQSSQGQDFISAFANATGADVAASTNFTGAAPLGGDWVLEANTGAIESTSALSASAIAAYADTLSTPSPIEYALMAGDSYISTRNPINQFPIPAAAGWTRIDHTVDAASGFEAATFSNGTDIVISYAGTYDDGSSTWWQVLTNPDTQADIALGLGYMTQQLELAAQYYIKTAILNPSVNISFTGHSLGGGLASLMAVFFNKTALTFDQAPFHAAASFKVTPVPNLPPIITDQGYINAQLLVSYLQTEYPLAPSLSNLLEPLNSYSYFGGSLTERQANVSDFSVRGELLSSSLPFSILSRIGNPSLFLENGASNVDAGNLHSQALLTAFLQSDETTKTDGYSTHHSFSKVTYKLPDLLPMIFSNDLYNNGTDAPNPENFIERLVRHEFGNAPAAATSDLM